MNTKERTNLGIRSSWPLRVSTILAVALSALVLGACGSDEESDTSASDETSSESYNATDAAFVASMLPHHEGGIELGQLAVEKGVDPKVKSIGQDIVDAQTQEVGQLEAMLERFGGMEGMEGMSGMEGMEGMMASEIAERDEMDLEALNQASGAEFDQMWLDVISAHHAAAVQMAMIEQEGGEDPEATDLAGSIVETQLRELGEFNDLVEQMEP